MKKFIITLFSLYAVMSSGLSLILVAPVSADLTQDVAGKSGYNTAGVTDTTLSETIGRIIKIVLSMVGTAFLVLTVYAGILWMTAAGNEEQVTKALSIIKASVIGLAIVMAAYGITYFVLGAIIGSTSAPSGQVGG